MYIVYPGSVNYTFLYQRPQQLMRCFGRMGYKGIYINGPAILEGATEYLEPTEVAENLTIIPPGTELSKYKDNNLFYYTYPPYRYVGKEINTKFTIFDSIDEPTGVFSHWNIDNIYEESVENADLVVASARKLYKLAKKMNPNVIYVPNGCDFEHFSQTQTTPYKLSVIPEPRIIFTGAIASWLDYELIYKTAEEFPNSSVVLVGPLYDVELENKPKNLHHLGHQPYQSLPGYLHNSDILIIPFDTNNPVIEATNPIKYWEYLATGKPIVTTDIPEIQAPCVYKAKNHDEFIEYISQLLESPSSYKKGDEGITLAHENSWQRRAKNIIKGVNNLI